MAGVAPRCRGEGIGLAMLGSCPDEKVRHRRTIRVVPRVVSRPFRGGIFCWVPMEGEVGGQVLDSSRGLGMTGESEAGREWGNQEGLSLQGHPPLDPSTRLRVSGPHAPGRAIKRVAPTEEGMDSCLRRKDGGEGRNGFPCRGTRMTVKDRQQTCRANG